MKAELDALIERVTAAERGDRFLDAHVRAVLEPPAQPVETDCPAYTTSIDAALTMVARVLEDTAYALINDYGGYNRAEINIAPGCDGFPPGGVTFHEVAETMPLAIILATLKALRSLP